MTGAFFSSFEAFAAIRPPDRKLCILAMTFLIIVDLFFSFLPSTAFLALTSLAPARTWDSFFSFAALRVIFAGLLVAGGEGEVFTAEDVVGGMLEWRSGRQKDVPMAEEVCADRKYELNIVNREISHCVTSQPYCPFLCSYTRLSNKATRQPAC